MNRILRVAAAGFALAAMGFWIVWVFAVSDFNEAPALLGGGLWCLAAFALTSHAKRAALPWIVVFVCAGAMLFVGGRALAAAGPQQAARCAATDAVLLNTAQSLRDYRTLRGDLPYGSWSEMTAALQEAGAWRAITVPAARGGKPQRLERAPAKDEWGCPYAYARDAAGGFVVKSSGPDRRWNTADDIIVSESPGAPVTRK